MTPQQKRLNIVKLFQNTSWKELEKFEINKKKAFTRMAKSLVKLDKELKTDFSYSPNSISLLSSLLEL